MRGSLIMEAVRWAFPCARWAPGRDDWSLCARCVQPEEKQRIAQFMFSRDAKAAMAGRLLIRKLIAEKLQIPWDKIVLDRSAKGKPFLVSGIPPHIPNFSFNVSHQGDFAVLAAESELQVGVDIMKTDRPGSGSTEEFFRIMHRQFTEREWRSIKHAGSDGAQLDMFYRHWALKESFTKAIGVGLGFNLQRIEFEVSPVHMELGKVYTQTKMRLDDDEDEDWSFEEALLDEKHHVAVALGGKDTNKPPQSQEGTLFTVLTYEELMASSLPITPEDLDFWDNFQSKQEFPRRQNSTAKAKTVT
ncbi:L-aminoadipate-semialdehyde dehydrogenase-phosphopantetheinyl transferase isoform X3 [Ranitomeya imitator]|uniref:L-aminoadipate-semialdehyde dehydrogenase-phosphopantetheinyl transferase isoform X3 n=1 Tax=Ranitomeya imitator TaxID=111125 RepID=UPI0037E8BC1A